MIFDGSFELADPRRKTSGRGRMRSGESLGRTGRYVRAARPGPEEKFFDVALDATLKAAALRGAAGGAEAVFHVLPADLRKKVRVSRGNRLVLFLVDASDSMDSFAQLSAAKGAVLSLLSAAYIRRDRVGLITFRDERARVLLPPTSSIHLARERLRLLSAGGATPFADGLLTAWKTLRSEGWRHPSRKTVLVILSDGEANVPLVPGADKTAEIAAVGGLIKQEKIRTVFVDTNPPGTERREAKDLAGVLGAEYRRISRIRAGELVDLIGLWERN